MAEAFHLAQEGAAARAARSIPLRDYLIGAVLEGVPQAELTGHPVDRLPNHARFVFKGVDGNQLLMMLDLAGFACSSGSACKTGSPKPSEVLTSIGLNDDWALGSLRVTMGKDTTPAALQSLARVLPDLIERQRGLRGTDRTSPAG